MREFSFTEGERKLMNYFVVKSTSPLQATAKVKLRPLANKE